MSIKRMVIGKLSKRQINRMTKSR